MDNIDKLECAIKSIKGFEKLTKDDYNNIKENIKKDMKKPQTIV